MIFLLHHFDPRPQFFHIFQIDHFTIQDHKIKSKTSAKDPGRAKHFELGFGLKSKE